MKRCSTSLVIKEMQMKTTMRCHVTPIKMAMIKENRKQQVLERVWRHRNAVHCWWACKVVQPLWKTVRRLLKKLKLEFHVIQQFYFWIDTQKK